MRFRCLYSHTVRVKCVNQWSNTRFAATHNTIAHAHTQVGMKRNDGRHTAIKPSPNDDYIFEKYYWFRLVDNLSFNFCRFPFVLIIIIRCVSDNDCRWSRCISVTLHLLLFQSNGMFWHDHIRVGPFFTQSKSNDNFNRTLHCSFANVTAVTICNSSRVQVVCCVYRRKDGWMDCRFVIIMQLDGWTDDARVVLTTLP